MREHAKRADRLTLDEALAAMRRLGVAPEEFVSGYEDGFKGPEEPALIHERPAYRRGYRAGREAHERGAHKA